MPIFRHISPRNRDCIQLWPAEQKPEFEQVGVVGSVFCLSARDKYDGFEFRTNFRNVILFFHCCVHFENKVTKWHEVMVVTYGLAASPDQLVIILASMAVRSLRCLGFTWIVSALRPFCPFRSDRPCTLKPDTAIPSLRSDLGKLPMLEAVRWRSPIQELTVLNAA